MRFYGIESIIQQGSINDYIKYGIIFVSLLFLIVAISLYTKHRLQTKYRDLSIILFLVLLFMAGVQYSDYTQTESRYNQSSQMAIFIQRVAEEYQVDQEDVMVNSTQLTDGVIVKLNDAYYTVQLSQDQASYRLTRTYLINPEIDADG